MKCFFIACGLLWLGGLGVAQQASPAENPKSVTVAAFIDHDRMVVDVELPLADGSTRRVHAWVDNGNPDLEISRRMAMLLGLGVSCDDRACTAPPPREMLIGGMSVPLTTVKEAKIPLKPVDTAAVLVPGMNIEINIPSSVLRHYDVFVDYPAHKFSLGMPGTLHFRGSSGKVGINAGDGLIQVPSQIGKKKFSMALDLGASISFLAGDLFDKLAAEHADWPHMTGGVGPANVWGSDEESTQKVMRIDRLQFGPLFLTDVPVVDAPKDVATAFNRRAVAAESGVLGADVLQNYRIGFDYAHAMVYFDIGRLFNFPEFDVIGLVLRPEDDGRFGILAVVDFDGKPAVPSGENGAQSGDYLIAVNGIPTRGSTMGQVWAMLGGTPEQERKLTIARAGRQFTVVAQVKHFLPELPDEKDAKKKKN